MSGIDKLSFDAVRGYQARWAKLEADKADLDYRLSQFCSDLRAEFSKTTEGDLDFRSWTEHHLLNVGPANSEVLLARAKAFKQIAPATPQQWKSLGGWKQVREIKKLPENVQKKVVANALANKTGVRQALGNLHITPPASQTSYKADADAMAKYLNKTYSTHPIEIRNIVKKYI